MSDSSHQTTNLVDSLNQKALLGLAAEDSEAGKSRPAYTLPSADELADLFPDLQIIDMVGTGGMGCVFRARQTKLERDVAIKILPRELGSDDLFAERFGREARAMARLNHPNIVSIYDFGEGSGLHYLVMEYMDGMNLRELLDSGTLETNDALRIFQQVCQALAYAHAEGVVHRDIKPENILFSKMGHVALADFGLARLATDSNVAVSLTQTRQAMGTLNYMAPEQWENPKGVDFRADIYSLGILLYELLTGRIPRGSFPPASTLCDIPTSIDEAINKALQIDAADRHQSVTDFCHAVVAEATPDSQVAAFDQNGTFTNFMNIGANVLRRVPTPKVVQYDGWMARHAVWTSLFSAFLVAALSLGPWLSNGRSDAMGVDTYVLVDQVQIPTAFVPIVAGLVFLLALVRRPIHPIRADLISLVLCGLCIAQVTWGLDEELHSYRLQTGADQITICPFLVLLILIFQTIETLIRLTCQFWAPVVRLFEQNKEKEQKKKLERKAIWRARWNTFVDGWHEFLGRDRIRRSDRSDDQRPL